MMYSSKTLLASALILRAEASGSGSGSGSGITSGSGSGTDIISGSGSGSISGSGSGSISGSGGGSGSGVLEPTTTCEDYPNWMDVTGWTCAEYAEDTCRMYTDTDENGVHPITACCKCGGGNTYGSNWFMAVPNEGCESILYEDSCKQASFELATTFQVVDDPNVPYGCFIQVIDNTVVYNRKGRYFTTDGSNWHEMDWCPQDLDGVCIIKAMCEPNSWNTRKDGTSCPQGEHLTRDECLMVFEYNVMFQEGDIAYNGNSPDLPQGCFGDRTTYGGGFNENPNGFLADFDSNEGGEYFYWPFCRLVQTDPTPQPTYFERPTPAPTGSPTMVPEVNQKVIEFVLQNKHGGFCFDAKNRRDRGGTVHMWECQQKGEALDWNRNQHWDMHVMGENLENVRGMVKSHDGICLDASEAHNGGKVWMWPCKNNNKRQMWVYYKVSGHLQSAVGNFCLDARQRITQGGYVHMWSCLPGEKNQQFHMLQNPAQFPYESKLDYSTNILETGTWSGDGPASEPPMPEMPFFKQR